MSGVIVERRDHVLMTGGRWPPARAFSTAFKMPLSMNGPFLTERAMRYRSISHWQLPIADLKTLNFSLFRPTSADWEMAIANRQLLSSPILQDHLLRALALSLHFPLAIADCRFENPQLLVVPSD
jgi:hypothetical protein